MPKTDNKSKGLEKARVYSAREHSISPKKISNNALLVMQKINSAGFDAYLVGGSVRDMLLKKLPKDFDVATNATPEQIRQIFRNARIIGRRFRIVHVRFSREIIEVTTFRGSHQEQHSNQQSSSSEEGILLRDNVFGSIEEDALRRDFTSNALYYDMRTNSVYDFCNGMQDIKDTRLRLIGEATNRYTEDPVRMLRAVRFASKLGFTLDEDTDQAITACAPLLEKISPARLFDESLKLFCNGYAEETFLALSQYDLVKYLFTQSELLSPENTSFKLVQAALNNSDGRIRQGKSITPIFLYAAFLWPHLQQMLSLPIYKAMPPYQAMQQAAQALLKQQCQYAEISRYFQTGIIDIWLLQLRLARLQNDARAIELLSHNRLRAAYDFLLLREQVGELPEGLGQWWTAFMEKNPIPASTPIKRSRKPARRSSSKRKTTPTP